MKKRLVPTTSNIQQAAMCLVGSVCQDCETGQRKQKRILVLSATFFVRISQMSPLFYLKSSTKGNRKYNTEHQLAEKAREKPMVIEQTAALQIRPYLEQCYVKNSIQIESTEKVESPFVCGIFLFTQRAAFFLDS